MEKHYIFDRKYLDLKLHGINSQFHEYIISLHKILSEYPYLYKHNNFLFGQIDIKISGIDGLGVIGSLLMFSMAFTDPETNICLEFIVTFELELDSEYVGKPSKFDINIQKCGSPVCDGNISMSNYIEYYKLTTYNNIATIQTEKTFEENLTSFLGSASIILEGPMSNIVSGINWTPIPIDWHGYK